MFTKHVVFECRNVHDTKIENGVVRVKLQSRAHACTLYPSSILIRSATVLDVGPEMAHAVEHKVLHEHGERLIVRRGAVDGAARRQEGADASLRHVACERE